MIALRGITVCGCSTEKFKETPERVCENCDLPYSVMTLRWHQRERDNPRPRQPVFNPCGEVLGSRK